MRQDGPDAPAVVEHAELRATLQVDATVAISPAWLFVVGTTSPPPAVQVSIPTGYPCEVPAWEPEQPKPWRLLS